MLTLEIGILEAHGSEKLGCIFQSGRKYPILKLKSSTEMNSRKQYSVRSKRTCTSLSGMTQEDSITLHAQVRCSDLYYSGTAWFGKALVSDAIIERIASMFRVPRNCLQVVRKVAARSNSEAHEGSKVAAERGSAIGNLRYLLDGHPFDLMHTTGAVNLHFQTRMSAYATRVFQ